MQYLLEGFASHLSTLDPRPASYDACKLMGELFFALSGSPTGSGGKGREVTKRRSLKKHIESDKDSRHKREHHNSETFSQTNKTTETIV